MFSRATGGIAWWVRYTQVESIRADQMAMWSWWFHCSWTQTAPRLPECSCLLWFFQRLVCHPVTWFWCADEKLGTIWTQCSICHGQCARTCVLRIKSSFSDPFSTSILQNFSSAQGVPLSLAPSAGHTKEHEEHSGLTMVVGKRPQGTGSAKPCFRDFSLVFNFTVFCSYLYYFSFVLHLNLFSFIFKIKLWDRI